MKDKDYKFQRLRKGWQLNRLEKIFRREADIRIAVELYRNDISGKNSVSGIVKDPTASEAIRNLQEVRKVTLPDDIIVEYPEKWLFVIDSAYSQFTDNPPLLKALQMRFRSGMYYERIIRKTMLSKASFYNGIRELISVARAMACELKLMSMFDKDEECPEPDKFL